nr:DUF1572 family protein [Ginsengibacter hankyongi]
MTNEYLADVKKRFEDYKMLGEKTFAQVPDEKLFWKFNEESNSIATIVKHLWGNMLSRWTNFLTTDGEKNQETAMLNLKMILQPAANFLKNGMKAGVVYLTP